MIKIEAAMRLKAYSARELTEEDVADAMESHNIKFAHVKDSTWLAKAMLPHVKELLIKDGWQERGGELSRPRSDTHIVLTPHDGATQVDFDHE